MNVKAIIGLLAVGAAALAFSSRGSGRRRRAAFGSPPEEHGTRFDMALTAAEQHDLAAEQHVVEAAAAWRGVTEGDDGKPTRIAPEWRRFTAGKACSRAMRALTGSTGLLGAAMAEHRGGANAAMKDADARLRDATENHNAVLVSFHEVCQVGADYTGPAAPARGFRGLGLEPAQHGINRSTHSVQAGFKIKDAVKAARKGWCASAIRALREAEYESGQTTAHSKSITDASGEMQRRKAQATRVAVNRAAKIVMEACTVHRARPRAESKRQGKLPF